MKIYTDYVLREIGKKCALCPFPFCQILNIYSAFPPACDKPNNNCWTWCLWIRAS